MVFLMQRLWGFSLLFFFCMAPLGAEEESSPGRFDWAAGLMPHYVNLHSGSYLGLLAIGPGYSFIGNLYQVELLYGYVPAIVGGWDIHTLSLKNNIHPYEYRRYDRSASLFFGFSGIYLLNPDSRMYFLRNPGEFPAGYYYPTRGRVGIHSGILYKWPAPSPYFSRYGIYAELSALDVYIAARHYEHRGRTVADIISWGFGFSAYL